LDMSGSLSRSVRKLTASNHPKVLERHFPQNQWRICP
jgi:hypothetical protein